MPATKRLAPSVTSYRLQLSWDGWPPGVYQLIFAYWLFDKVDVHKSRAKGPPRLGARLGPFKFVQVSGKGLEVWTQRGPGKVQTLQRTIPVLRGTSCVQLVGEDIVLGHSRGALTWFNEALDCKQVIRGVHGGQRVEAVVNLAHMDGEVPLLLTVSAPELNLWCRGHRLACFSAVYGHKQARHSRRWVVSQARHGISLIIPF
uniref:Uncharacterized protein n=1 Tax=viral metagenome TaxID=1070528 RepID=A0A6C0BPV4_9ZZZZ